MTCFQKKSDFFRWFLYSRRQKNQGKTLITPPERSDTVETMSKQPKKVQFHGFRLKRPGNRYKRRKSNSIFVPTHYLYVFTRVFNIASRFSRDRYILKEPTAYRYDHIFAIGLDFDYCVAQLLAF